MKNNRKIWVRALVLVLVAALMLPMAACRRNQQEETTGPADPQAASQTYTVQVQTAGGMALSGVGVYIYEDETMAELVWFDQTGEDGTMSFTDVVRNSYVAVLSDVPTGYSAADFYPITGEVTTIVLEVGTLDEDSAKDLVYKLGDMMMDFTVVGSDGTEYTLSELLKQKKAVMLNFWYIGCEPCKAEFPYLQEAYEQYSEDVAVLAMNHIDPEADIAAFQKENGYTFPMVSCDPVWQQLMNLTAYPTTVMIDRFGNICLIHRGTIDNAKTFEDTFAYFAAEEYEPKPVKDITELLTEEEEGSKENPNEVGGQASFQVEVEPGKEVYTQIYKAKGMYLSIQGKDKNFYVLYNDKTYTPDGSNTVGFVVSTGDNYTPAVFAIGNTGTEKQTYNVYLSHLAGTFNNPYSLKLGEFTATVNAGNNQGIYYRGTAPEDGTFTVQCISAPAGIKYDFSLQSMDVSWTVLRNYGGDGNVDPETGYPTVRLQMKKGMDIMFSVGTLPDDSNSCPGGTFKFLLSFEAGEVQGAQKIEKIDYTVTVTDEADQPLAGVAVWLTKEEQTVSAKTDDKGGVTMNLEKGTYTGTVSVPEGYTLENNAFTLTEEAPTATVKLAAAVDTRVEYAVTVYSPEWEPAAGVEVVILGAGSAVTNDEGVAVFKLEPGNYTVLTGQIPNGWECSDMLTLTAEQVNGELYLQYALGTEQNPIALQELSNPVTNTGTVYYSAFFNGATMEVTGDGDFTVLLDGNTLTPADGVVSQLIQTGNPRMPAVFAIVGDGEFSVSFTYPAGHQMNPAPLVLGVNTATQTAGASDYYYQWTAPGTGELTVSMDASANWLYSVSNQTTGVASDIHWSDDETPVYAETLTVSEGDVILVTVNTYDPADMFQNPAGDVVTTAAFVWTLPCESFTTAPVAASGSWNYRLASPDSATLTIENANAYVIYGNTTYGPDSEGKVTVALGSEAEAELTIGNMNTADAESFEVSVSWPVGSKRNPQELRFRFPMNQTLNLAEGDTDGYYYVLHPSLTGTLTLTRRSNGVEAEAYTVVVDRNNGEEILTPAEDDDTKTIQVYVFPDDALLIHVQAAPDAEGNYPAVSNIRINGTFVQDYTTYTVTFDPNGGTLTGEATAESSNGKLPALPADPVRADYKFLGWFDAVEGGNQLTTATSIKSDMTVYARWEKIEYNITFDARGGVLEGEATLRTENYLLASLPEVSMAGYTFQGWFDLPAGGNQITSGTVFTDHTTVYAQWKSDNAGGDTGEMITYQVSVVNEKGEPVTSGVYVTWQNSERMETRIINNASGSVSAQLPAAQYTVMLTMTGAYAGYCYDAASAVTNGEDHDITVQIAKPLAGDAAQTDYDSLITLDVPMGATYVKLTSSQVNYAVEEGVGYCFFRFAITEEGRYAFSVSNGAAITNWGSNTFYIHDQSTEAEREANEFMIEVKDTNIPADTGVLYQIFAVEVTADFADTILLIEDAGDAEYTYLDAPFTVFEGTQAPEVEYVDGKAAAIKENIFNLTTGGKTLTYVDMLNDKAVKGDDGYYHLNSKTGPILYVNLGEEAPYVSMGILTGAIGQYGTGFKKIFYNDDGTPAVNSDGTYKKEDYTDAMIAYALHADPTTGAYPLTDDLIYMLQHGGEYKGWYTPGSGTYLFEEQDITVDNALAWMFAVCYLK